MIDEKAIRQRWETVGSSARHAQLWRRSTRRRQKVSKAEIKCLDITGDQFHPEWNYTIRPRQPQL